MPVSPTYPGVYIEEVPSGVHTITGVATSIAAFFGRASKGPINKAVRILSPADYKRTFGDPHPQSDLADSVRLFFTNGGTEGYVIRLAKGTREAQVTLRSLKTNEDVLVATAKAAGLWGNTVRLEVDYKAPNPDETFNLRVIQEADGKVAAAESFTNLSMNPTSPRFAPTFVTQSSDLITLALDGSMGTVGDINAKINKLGQSLTGFSQSRRPLSTLPNVCATLDGLVNAAAPDDQYKFDISVNYCPFVTVTLTPWPGLNAATLQDVQDHFQDQINGALATVAPPQKVVCTFETSGNVRNLLTITADSGDKSSVRVRRASSNDIAAALMLGVDQGGIEPVRWSNFRPAPTASMLRLGSSPPDTLAKITETLNKIADLNQDAFNQVKIDGKSVYLDATTDYNLITTNATDDWFKSKPVPGSLHGNNDGIREKLRLMAQAINAAGDLPYRAEVWGYHLAVMAKEGTLNKIPNSFSTGAADFDYGLTLNVRQYSLGTASTSAFVNPIGQVDGSDGDAPGVAEYLGDPAKQEGLYALDPVDLFNLMVLPGDEEVDQATVLDLVLGPASAYCQAHRAFLLIDAPTSWIKKGRPEVVQNTSLVDGLRSLVVKDYAAVFFPRLRYAANGLKKTIGPAGAIAGLMARIDSTRGVWKAPAGLEADLRGILGLELKLTDGENGVLNQLGVNCLRIFPGGFITWGARTLEGYDNSDKTEWKYIPIRRFALFLEESLFRGTKWVVFEPNDEPLWAKIRMNLRAFMMGLFRQGAFQGSTPDQAFYVKCDSDTTTQADRNLGIVNIEVGFAPLKPAEFVIIKIQQMAGQL